MSPISLFYSMCNEDSWHDLCPKQLESSKESKSEVAAKKVAPIGSRTGTLIHILLSCTPVMHCQLVRHSALAEGLWHWRDCKNYFRSAYTVHLILLAEKGGRTLPHSFSNIYRVGIVYSAKATNCIQEPFSVKQQLQDKMTHWDEYYFLQWSTWDRV